MTLTLDLPPDLERQLAREAERRGQAVDDCARILLEERLAAASAQELSEEQQPGPAIQELSDLLGALDTLITRTEDYDEEFLAPTPSASDAAHALVSATYGREPRLRTLRPAFSTIGDGSLYVSWKTGAQEVRVLIPPDERSPVRLYHRDASGDGVDGHVTTARLVERLVRLVRE